MNSKIAVMADPDTVTGFMLGGIKEGYPVKDTEEAGKKLEELIKEDFSIIITTEKIGDELRSSIDKLTGERALPMIIEIPDKGGSIERASDPMRELIKRVIGVEMVK
ncbi:MAG: V-type ATP synthase subunit F [Methanobacterium sp.]|uniref:V-type ATP synthase subunit F n=1 Tax=Methanobacterium sp. TaxID=2164 RepID=UPI003D660B9A|nr:V-type ATP synthase subunit F [Methanobacterium sp.]